MSNRKFFFGILIGAAVFVYLIGAFLIASFNIAMWKDGHRFFAVVIYLFLVWSSLKALAEPTKKEEPKQRELEADPNS
ncbi:hypothetical protein F5984_26070 [Rudanella paleaurantiibacter]|uniref:Uncharacterized protein n=1 Tax=Rudanella paleaurantiibacter TaxID=2614655 RepID=A0A7J5TRS2_9BACT|nr:hypothetical protein [Rudanella paleaurantiibacter]KAB7725508.1 hypothetical protein F5984_26070 [Rudanella paleaurantiibacter]